MPLLAKSLPEYREKVIRQLSVLPEKVTADRQDFTRMSHDPSHGTQVSYSAPDGRSYLWYPGNTIILRGMWEVREDFLVVRQPGNEFAVPYAKICFWFGENTYNPVTKRGPGWECGAAGNVGHYLVEARKGDVLGLVKRERIPFVLEKEKTSLDALLARIKKIR